MTWRLWIDIPPAWLALSVAVLWMETALTGGLPMPVVALWAGRAMVALGLALMAAALLAFQGARTTPVPHQTPSAMISSGIFALTRNPIYLGDACVLLGLGLLFGAVSVVGVLPAFVYLVDRRFIRAEEARLAAAFPAEWPPYRDRVRRWF